LPDALNCGPEASYRTIPTAEPVYIVETAKGFFGASYRMENANKSFILLVLTDGDGKAEINVTKSNKIEKPSGRKGIPHSFNFRSLILQGVSLHLGYHTISRAAIVTRFALAFYYRFWDADCGVEIPALPFLLISKKASIARKHTRMSVGPSGLCRLDSM
jgi:hypothetical protein